MLDLIGTTVLAAVIAVDLNTIFAMMPQSSRQRHAAVTAFGLWIGLAIALAARGLYSPAATPFPTIAVMAGLPVVAAAIAALSVARIREALLGLPVAFLVGLNAARLLGVFFLLLTAQNRLSGPFPQFAGWGDIIVGLIAIPLTSAMIRNPNGNRRRLLLWNMLGTLDLIVAVTLGLLSAPGSPLQVFGGAIGSAAVWTLPWAVIPTLLVPFYLTIHGVIFVRLALARGQSPAGPGVETLQRVGV
jgi:hypothetical protein